MLNYLTLLPSQAYESMLNVSFEKLNRNINVEILIL